MHCGNELMEGGKRITEAGVDVAQRVDRRSVLDLADDFNAPANRGSFAQIARHILARMMPLNAGKDALLAAFYFLASTAITWWFIARYAVLYDGDRQKMLLSCGIAGAKWGIQVLAALLFLREKRWPFLRQIGFTCFAGSCILLSVCEISIVKSGPRGFFLGGLAACVAAMIVLYYYSVRRSSVSIKWFWGWICCLAAAITLQLTVVFGVI